MATQAETGGRIGAADNGLARYFELARYNVTFGGEVMAGITTFLTMAYIAFVNPGILSSVPDGAGVKLDFGATVTATCWVAAFLCILMGAFARRPFAMASGMGLNAVVAFQLVGGQKLTWGEAFGIVVVEGIVITLLVLTKFRVAVFDAVPQNLKRAIAAGIGLFILFIGLNEGGLVAGNPIYAKDPTVPPVQLGNLGSWTVLVTVVGLIVAVLLHLRGNRGALLIGIAAATLVAFVLNAAFGIYDPKFGWAVLPSKFVTVPTMPYFFGLDLGAYTKSPVSGVLNTFAIMLSDFFDTMGTLIGLGALAGFLVKRGPVGEGHEDAKEVRDDENLTLPDIEKPLLVDSIGPIVGGAFGASSATSYIEAGSGISAGGRTGITAITVGVLFALVPFFTPIIAIVPPQATAPALILVGAFMISVLADVDWRDFKEAFPVLITMIAMPLTYSITNGIGFGFILFVLVALFTNRGRRIHPLMWASSVAFVVYFLSEPIKGWLGV